MFTFWKSLSYTTKFSTLAFLVTFTLGLLSMGALGALLYYPVSFLFQSYPTLNHWSGDWVWPAVIVVGIVWSFGFIIGGVVWHYLSRWTQSVILLRLQYTVILWGWAALLWYVVLSNQMQLT